MRGAVLILCCVCLGGAAWWAFRAEEVPKVPAPVFAANQPPRPAAVQTLKAAPTPVADVPDRNGQILLPDGTFVPALNGVDTGVHWGKQKFTPIVGRHTTDTGVEWYVHEDGSQSTTVKVHGAGPSAHGIKSVFLYGRMEKKVFPLKPGIVK